MHETLIFECPRNLFIRHFNTATLKRRFGWEQSGSFASYAVSFLSLYYLEPKFLIATATCLTQGGQHVQSYWNSKKIFYELLYDFIW